MPAYASGGWADAAHIGHQLTSYVERGGFKAVKMRVGVIDGAVKKLLDEGLDQEKETEADTVGEVFAARVGYDAEAYVGLLTRLRDLKGDDRALFKTHPNFSARIEAVQKTIRTKRLVSNGLVLQERFSRMTKRV